MSERIGLFLEPLSLQAQAGGEAVEAVLTAENRSTIVDQFALSLEGLEPAWYDLSSTVAGLFPGERAQVRLSLHPPRTIEAQAGSRAFTIKVSSLANPEEYSLVEGSLEVLAFGATSFEMSPERLEGRRGATQLLFRSQSNAPTLLTLQATDLEEGLNYRFSVDTVTIPAGGESTVNLTLWPKRRPLFGSSYEYRFRVMALEPGQQPEETTLAAEGTFTYLPPLAGVPRALAGLWRRLRPVLPLLLSLVALGLAVAAFLKPPPTVETPAPAAPPPVIQSFRSETGPRGTVLLRWQVEGAQQVRIDGKEVTPQGTLQVDRLENKEYTLEASNEGGTVRQRLGIVVLKPPTIAAFDASPTAVSPGGTVTLGWKVQNATKVSVDGTPVPAPDIASGKREVRPEQTRDYVLVAENDVGWVVRRVTVQVK